MPIHVELQDSVYVAKLDDETSHVPCLPYEDLSRTFKIKSGVIVKYMSIKELGYGNTFYVIEIIDTGDIVLLPTEFSKYFLRIPSKNKFR